MTCCFSGHRKIPAEDLPRIMAETECVVRRLVESRVAKDFRVGGAVGYDTEVAELLFRLRAEYPQIHVTLVYPFDGYTDGWTEEQKSRYNKLLPLYDAVIRASEKGGREAYLKRDRLMVDMSDVCICYCTRSTGGTAYTMRYALKQGRDVIRIDIRSCPR